MSAKCKILPPWAEERFAAGGTAGSSYIEAVHATNPANRRAKSRGSDCAGPENILRISNEAPVSGLSSYCKTGARGDT